VPVFAYGAGSEYFNGVTVENIEIPKQIARLWGEEKFGQ
jgi:alkaline phosphatase